MAMIETVTKEDFVKRMAEKSQALMLGVSRKLASIHATKRKNEKTPYHFSILDSFDSFIINDLVAKKGVQEFFELTTPQISFLQPRIRLYKNYLNNEQRPDDEFLFSNYFHGENLRSSADAINEMYGYLGNVGIRNFEFVNQATDPATMYQYKCSLSLFFGNMEELTADQGNGTTFLDLLMPPLLCSHKDYYRLKAVVGFSRTGGAINHLEAGESADLMPEAIQSAIDSWNFVMYLERTTYNFEINEDGTILITIDFISSLDRILESEDANLIASPLIKEYLSVVNQLSEVIGKLKTKLQTNIQYGLAAAPGDFSPLMKIKVKNLAEGTEQVLESDLEFVKLAEMSVDQRNRHLRDLGFDESTASFLTYEEQFGDKNLPVAAVVKTFDQLNAKLRENQAMLTALYDQRYQTILRDLLTGGNMFYFDINTVEIFDQAFLDQMPFGGGAIIYEDDESSGADFDGAIERFDKLMDNREFFDNIIPNISVKSLRNEEVGNAALSISDIGDSAVLSDEMKNEKKIAEQLQKFGIGKTTVQTEAEKIERAFEERTLLQNLEDTIKDTFLEGRMDIAPAEEVSNFNYAAQTQTANPFELRFYYLTLGDLLNAALGIAIMNGSNLSSHLLLLGTTSFNIGGELITINIADLPISRELFLDWFNKYIFDAKRTKLTIREFLTNMAKIIIPSAMSAGIWEANARYLEEIQIISFSVEKSKFELLKSKAASNLSDIMQTAQLKTFRSPTDMMEVVYIRGADFPINQLSGNPNDDFPKGIYHLLIGSDRGIVKKVKFSKVDDENIVASNISKSVKNGSFGEETITTFYDADVTMVGNTFFVPGQLVYINPTFVGLGSPKGRNSLARKIGIGGYYDVLSVSSKIEPGVFETQIKAKWKGFDGEGVLSSGQREEAEKEIAKALERSESNREGLKKIAETNGEWLKDNPDGVFVGDAKYSRDGYSQECGATGCTNTWDDVPESGPADTEDDTSP